MSELLKLWQGMVDSVQLDGEAQEPQIELAEGEEVIGEMSPYLRRLYVA